MFFWPLGSYKQQQFARDPDPRYAELGRTKFIFPRNWDQFDDFMQRIIEQNDAISINLFLKEKHKALGAWYRTKEPIT